MAKLNNCKPKTSIGINLSTEVLTKIDEKAVTLGISRSELIRQILNQEATE